MKNKNGLFFLLLAGLLTVGACGDDDDGSTSIIVNPDDGQQQQEEQGTYNGTSPIIINNRIDNNIRVTSRVRVDNDQVITDVDCQDAPDNVVHQQIIHIGVRCPTLADDTNADGYVDWAETQQVVGAPLISLDQNIENQEESGFPQGRNYSYSERASLESLRSSLPPGEDLNLQGKVLMIYGANPSTPLPPTVASNGNDPVYISMPIFCNVIQKVSGPTTTTTTGGAGTGTGTTTGTTTGGATTGTTTGGSTTGTTTGDPTTTTTTTGGQTGGTTSGTTTGTTTGTTGTTTGGTTTDATTTTGTTTGTTGTTTGI